MKSLITLSAIILFGTFSAYGQGQCTPPIAPPACVQSGGILSIVQLCEPRTRVVNGNVETYSCCQEFKTQCCAGLEIEKIGNDEACFKKDDSPLDTTLQSCSGNNACSGGKGCFVQDPDDLFGGETNSDAEESAQIEGQEAMDAKIEAVLGEDGEEKANGQGCTYHAECASYNCEAKKSGNSYTKTCQEKRICRLAQEDEAAPGAVQCEEGLFKDSSNICKTKQDATYLGLLGDVEVQTQQECVMTLPEEARIAGQSAMKALRSMEYIFANITDDGVTDCLRFIKPVLRDEIGKVLSAKRKEIVAEFNAGWALIKQDYQTIMAAQAVDASSNNMVTLHNIDGQPVQVQDGVIKSRTSSGLDMLIMMKRRNLLFKTYEEKMKLAVEGAFNDIKALEESMINSFHQNHRGWRVGWDVGSASYSKGDVKCNSGFLGFGSGKRKKVKKRVGKWFKVPRSQSSPLIQRELIVNSLAQMAGGNVNEAKSELGGSYNMLDPLIPEGVNAGVSSFAFLSIGSMTQLRNEIPKGIISYLKKFNPSNSSEFIYEPELVAITDGEVTKQEEIATCLNSVQELGTAKCKKLNEFVQDISDVSVAQIFAFSKKGNKKYTSYFHNVNSWRRRLLNYYSVNYANLVSYYTALGQYREEQNKCIDQRLGLVNQGLVTQGGFAPGMTNNYWDPNQYLQNLNGSTPSGSQSQTGFSVTHNFSGFTGATNTVKNGGALKDNIASGSGASGSSGASMASTSGGTFAANLKKMNDANKNNMSASEFNEKSKDVMDSIKSVGGGGSNGAGASSMASLGGVANKGGGLGGANAATLGSDLKGEADKKISDKSAGTTSGVASGSGSGAAAGSAEGFNALGGISAGSSSGMGSADASGSGAGYQDPTGMSDEEKDRLMANYERTKSKYSPNENDSLFNVVSKAYVRNLDKVLTKKKKNLEAQESK